MRYTLVELPNLENSASTWLVVDTQPVSRPPYVIARGRDGGDMTAVRDAMNASVA